jgi:6,7-dimethyl-8-ribityllumazine synthase
MSSALKNLSSFSLEGISTGATDMKFGILVSEWNTEITSALYEGALATLLELGATAKNIFRKNVPGSYELTLGAQYFAEYTHVDAIICLGCVIQGETRHFDFICQAVATGLTDISIKYNKPFIFGVLTTETLKQAKERSGGKHGNKGIEAAITAVKMIALKKEFTKK